MKESDAYSYVNAVNLLPGGGLPPPTSRSIQMSGQCIQSWSFAACKRHRVSPGVMPPSGGAVEDDCH